VLGFAVQQAQRRAASLHSLCTRLELPLTGSLLCATPSTPDGVSQADLETALSNLLASARSAGEQNAPLLAAHLQHSAALIVCGTDLCSASSSAFAEHVASELHSCVDALAQQAGTARVPLQPCTSSGRGARGAGCLSAGLPPDSTAAWEAIKRGNENAPACSSGAVVGMLRMRCSQAVSKSSSVNTVRHLAAKLHRTHGALSLRLHAGALQRAQEHSSAAELLQHDSFAAIQRALELPPPPPCLLGVVGTGRRGARRGGRGQGRGPGRAAVKGAKSAAQPAVEPALAWGLSALTAASCGGHAPAVAQVLTALAASVAAPAVAAAASAASAEFKGEQGQTCRLMPVVSQPDQTVMLTQAFGVAVCAVHGAQACAPASASACHLASIVASLLGADALACMCLQRGVGLANAHAAQFWAMQHAASEADNGEVRRGAERDDASCAIARLAMQAGRDVLEGLLTSSGAGEPGLTACHWALYSLLTALFRRVRAIDSGAQAWL
jgi:hypothetical protein